MVKHKCLFLAAIFGIVLISSETRAQEGGGPLEGVRVLRVAAADVTSDGADCGLEREMLRETFSAPIRTTPLRIEPSGGYWVRLRVTTILYNEQLCISNVEAQAFLSSYFFNLATATNRSGTVLLWSESQLIASSRDQHAEAVRETLAGAGSKFAEAWHRDQ